MTETRKFGSVIRAAGRKTRDSQKLKLLLALGFLLLIPNAVAGSGVEIWGAKSVVGKILIHLFAGVGEILLLSFMFGLFFDYSERLEVIGEAVDDAAQRFGFLHAVTQAGIAGLEVDPATFSHEIELRDSNEFRMVLRGSMGFFREAGRRNHIKARLDVGKKIIVCIHESRKADAEFWLTDVRGRGYKVENIEFFTHNLALVYNYIVVDNGIWIKTYFHNPRRLNFNPPAFYVAANTDLWAKYMQDINMITLNAWEPQIGQS